VVAVADEECESSIMIRARPSLRLGRAAAPSVDRPLDGVG
jgi:hypothetical protein